ncbi:DUF6090 family protein [Flavobacteriaceae bacterium S0862]|nr:DUF6090 family protein [Flavobacteriaceae bacterium S0862]
MIKFFRKIRQNLLSEGKAGKYFKYAIGEIVLVVIGILIALSINNWNEQRKQNSQEQYILNQLKVEFEADSVKINTLEKLTTGKINQSKYLLKLIKEYNKDSITLIPLKPIFLIGKAIPFYDYSPTYNELVNSGKLNVIRNDSIRVAINDFRNHNAQMESTLYIDMHAKKMSYMNHVYRYFNGEINGLLWQAKMSDLSKLLALGADYNGFMEDPNTEHELNKVLASDSELSFIYNRNVKSKLYLVLDLLNREIQK